MTMPRMKVLAVVELEVEFPLLDSVFDSFAEEVEGTGLAVSVGRATLWDLEEFAPHVAALQPGGLDLLVPSIDVEEEDE